MRASNARRTLLLLGIVLGGGLQRQLVERVRHVEKSGAIVGIFSSLRECEAFGGVAAIIFGTRHPGPSIALGATVAIRRGSQHSQKFRVETGSASGAFTVPNWER